MGDKDILEDSPDSSYAQDNGSSVTTDQGDPEAELDDGVIPCNPCFEEDTVRVNSEVFCLECKQFLCSKCRTLHRRFGVTRSHHLVERDSSDNESTEACSEHPGRNIDHFCEDHQALVCKACINVSHAACHKIVRIQDEADDVKNSKELLQGRDNLNNLIESFKRLKEFKTTQIQKSESQKEFCLGTIKDLRKKASDFFDRLEASAEHDLNDEITMIINATVSEEETFQSTIEALQNTKDNLEMTTQTSNDAQIYITLKRALRQVRKYSDFHSDIEKSLKDIDVEFKEDERFRQVFSVISAIGRVVTHSELTPSAQKFHRASSLTFKRKKAVPAGGHAVRIPGDRTTCYITGCVFLEDGRLILADHNNKCIKMFDVNFKLLSCHVARTRPNDIAVVNQDEIVTTLDEYTLQFLKLTNTDIKQDRSANTEVQYSGLACSKDPLLFASCSFEEGAGNVHMLDMEGNVINQIANAQTGDPIFVRPWSLVISEDDKLLFVNDLGQNAVVAIDVTTKSNCRTSFVYKDRNLELRHGICLDETGSIFVASGNRTIHQVSYLGTKVHEILTERDGIGQPHCLCLSPRNSKLLVAEFKENCVKVFKLM